MMSNITKASIFTSDKNLASGIKDRCQSFGLEVNYITRLSDFLSHIISANNEIVFVDHKFQKTRNVLSDFCKKYDNNIKIIYLIDKKDKASFIGCTAVIRENIDDIDRIIPVLIGEGDSFCGVSSNISIEELFMCVSSCLAEFKIMPRFLGYNYLIQGVVYAIKHCNNKIRLTDDIYKYLSEQNDSMVCNIEKNIRTAIRHSLKDNPHLFASIIDKDKKITNSTFIKHIIARTKIECMEKNLKN